MAVVYITFSALAYSCFSDSFPYRPMGAPIFISRLPVLIGARGVQPLHLFFLYPLLLATISLLVACMLYAVCCMLYAASASSIPAILYHCTAHCYRQCPPGFPRGSARPRYVEKRERERAYAVDRISLFSSYGIFFLGSLPPPFPFTSRMTPSYPWRKQKDSESASLS